MAFIPELFSHCFPLDGPLFGFSVLFFYLWSMWIIAPSYHEIKSLHRAVTPSAHLVFFSYGNRRLMGSELMGPPFRFSVSAQDSLSPCVTFPFFCTGISSCVSRVSPLDGIRCIPSLVFTCQIPCRELRFLSYARKRMSPPPSYPVARDDQSPRVVRNAPFS